MNQQVGRVWLEHGWMGRTQRTALAGDHVGQHDARHKGGGADVDLDEVLHLLVRNVREVLSVVVRTACVMHTKTSTDERSGVNRAPGKSIDAPADVVDEDADLQALELGGNAACACAHGAA